ncbi:MAG: beta-glucosidase BglX [Bacteroides sp.]|nr:beta-glucosidase BglX [Bacteroides sp.]
MIPKIHIIALLMLCVTTHIAAHTETSSKDEKAKDAFITSLMQKMTVEEKIAQLNLVTPTAATGPFRTMNATEKLRAGIAGNVMSVRGSTASVHKRQALFEQTRLQIPLFFGLDIIHGFKTVMPIPLGLSCAWDTLLVERTARVAALEATSMGYNWTYSPMVDISRDPRWGRVMEGSGEDPLLGSLIARAMVRGYQGDNLSSPTSLMACVKHFALYGASEAGRDYNTTDMSHMKMYQNYLPPYKAAVDAGAGSIMTSFNDIDGLPATVNHWLLNDLLRKEWGFNGFIVTDYNCIGELPAHGVAADGYEAAKKALDAGVDMDMSSEHYSTYLKTLLDRQEITLEQIDTACRRVLEAKYDLGLFDNPYKNYGTTENCILTPENISVAIEAARKSMVLLKNQNNVLPLKPDAKIALIGPAADNKFEMISMWAPDGLADSVCTIRRGLEQRTKFLSYAQGTFLSDHPWLTDGYTEEAAQQRMDEALGIARDADVIVAVLGEGRNLSGEAKSMTNISMMPCQRKLLQALKETGKPIVLLLLNGRSMTIEAEIEMADAVVDIWRPGTGAGQAVADVLYGDYNPSGKLTMTWPRSVGQIPIYYNAKNTGRPYKDGERGNFKSRYIDSPNAPLFPFGYGLSYTTFNYGDIALSDTLVVGESKTLQATIELTNTGSVSGTEIVQLYVGDPAASVTRPVKELKHFRHVTLRPGEKRKVSFTLTPEDLKFWSNDLKYDWESGLFNLFIGTNSADVKVAQFRWEKQR